MKGWVDGWMDGCSLLIPHTDVKGLDAGPPVTQSITTNRKHEWIQSLQESYLSYNPFRSGPSCAVKQLKSRQITDGLTGGGEGLRHQPAATRKQRCSSDL